MALLCLLGAIGVWQLDAEGLGYDASTVGTVVTEPERVGGRRRAPMYGAEVEYHPDGAGAPIVQLLKVADDTRAGDRVTVWYRSTRPTEAVVADFHEGRRRWTAGVLAVLGFALAGWALRGSRP